MKLREVKGQLEQRSQVQDPGWPDLSPVLTVPRVGENPGKLGWAYTPPLDTSPSELTFPSGTLL